MKTDLRGGVDLHDAGEGHKVTSQSLDIHVHSLKMYINRDDLFYCG